MDIKISGHNYQYDITSMAMLFFPGEKVNYVSRSSNKVRAFSSLKTEGDKLISTSRFIYNGNEYKSVKSEPVGYDEKNLVKQTFYTVLKKATGISSPWGILTGIRPLSVYMKHIKDKPNPSAIMKKVYFLSDDKTLMLSEIYKMQKEFLNSDKKDISIYFCSILSK